VEYINSYTKFYTDVFDKLKIFDILTFQEIEKLYLEVTKSLIKTGQWKLNDSINKESFKKTLVKTPSGKEKYVFEKGSLYSEYNESYLNIKPCITGKSVAKKVYEEGKFVVLSIPKEIINNFQTNSINTNTLDIVREFVKDVEDTCGWDGDWRKVEKIYDIRCGNINWKSDFSFEWYVSMKEDGIIFPPFFLDEAFLTRGTHRSYLGALAGYDYLFFHKYNSDNFKILSGNKYWVNDKLELDVDLLDRSIGYKLYNSNKLIGKLKL